MLAKNDIEKLKDANYVIYKMYHDKYIDKLYKFPLYLFVRNFLKFLLIGLWHFILTLKNLSFYKNNYNGKTLFISLSKNNFNVLKPICDNYGDNGILLSTDYRNNKNDILITKLFPFIFSVFLTPIKIFNLFFLDYENRRKSIIFLNEYLLFSGYNIFFNLFFRLQKPSKIVIANDHVQFTRILVRKAKIFGVKTFYLQHGCITQGFPSLITDHALLDGDYSKDIYLKKNTNNTKIEIIGMTKIDNNFFIKNNSLKIQSIGICSTATTSYNDISNIMDFLLNNYPDLKLFFRPHPSEMIEKKYDKYNDNDSIKISDSNKSHPLEFLSNVDAIISGNSAVLLEAALVNVFPIYFFSKENIIKYNDDNFDRYGFVKNGIAVQANNLFDLEIIINKALISKPNFKEKAKYYCSNLENSKDIISNAISIIKKA